MAKTAREPLSESPCVYACWPGPVSPDQTNKHHGQEEQKRDYLVTILEALLLTTGLAWQESGPPGIPILNLLTQIYI